MEEDKEKPPPALPPKPHKKKPKQQQQQQQLKSPKDPDLEKEAERIRAVVTHRRKNSYKIAQEKEPLEWNQISMRERRKSMGDSLEQEQRARAAAAEGKSAGKRRGMYPRNSSSLGNIISSQEEEQRASPLNFDQQITRRPHQGQAKKRKKQPSSSASAKKYHSGDYSAAAASASAATSVNLRSSYHYERHPLSHSTTAILDSDDPQPIVPNRCPGTPDVWVLRTVKA